MENDVIKIYQISVWRINLNTFPELEMKNDEVNKFEVNKFRFEIEECKRWLITMKKAHTFWQIMLRMFEKLKYFKRVKNRIKITQSSAFFLTKRRKNGIFRAREFFFVSSLTFTN